MDKNAKPLPRLNAINRPFFEACKEDRLVLQRCKAQACGRYIYFPRVCCPHCQGGELEWVEASGAGTIVTYTVVHRPNHPSFFPEAPYYFIAVRLREGPLMYSRLAERPDPALELIGAAVQVSFVAHGE
ncbi:MAG: OB-fold domain-containing protein, partial [Chthoniobacteraceae bacterium]